VLVIIGLLAGGVLVGQDLISAAAVRAQISQIEKYNTAVRTFQGKYGGLPGDIPDPTASQFGFIGRGTHVAQGDGNGIISGFYSHIGNYSAYGSYQNGETIVFWGDLSKANLIDGTFSTVTSGSSAVSGTNYDLYFPKAKIGNGNYVYVHSGGTTADGINYFGVSVPIGSLLPSLITNVGITVAQAYNIDKKVDDGLPQSGNVLAFDVNLGGNQTGASWVSGSNSLDTKILVILELLIVAV